MARVHKVDDAQGISYSGQGGKQFRTKRTTNTAFIHWG